MATNKHEASAAPRASIPFVDGFSMNFVRSDPLQPSLDHGASRALFNFSYFALFAPSDGFRTFSCWFGDSLSVVGSSLVGSDELGRSLAHSASPALFPFGKSALFPPSVALRSHTSTFAPSDLAVSAAAIPISPCFALTLPPPTRVGSADAAGSRTAIPPGTLAAIIGAVCILLASVGALLVIVRRRRQRSGAETTSESEMPEIEPDSGVPTTAWNTGAEYQNPTTAEEVWQADFAEGRR
jgi:hypothetical protein